MKRRFGESVMGDEMENAKWFAAYNKITSDKEGVSLEDFKFGDIVMETIMMR